MAAHSFVAIVAASFGLGTPTQAALQLTSLRLQAAMQLSIAFGVYIGVGTAALAGDGAGCWVSPVPWAAAMLANAKMAGRKAVMENCILIDGKIEGD